MLSSSRAHVVRCLSAQKRKQYGVYFWKRFDAQNMLSLPWVATEVTLDTTATKLAPASWLMIVECSIECKLTIQ